MHIRYDKADLREIDNSNYYGDFAMPANRKVNGLILDKRQFVSLISAFLLICALAVSVRAEFEEPRTLSAASLLDKDILQGEHHKVDDQVRNDGMFNHYEVESSFGVVKASSNSGLFILINEINAIAAMKQVETDDTMMNSLKQSGKSTVEGVKNLFSEPEETIEGAAAGIGSLFNRAKQTVGKREVADVEDNKAKQLIGFSRSKGEIANQYGVNVYSRNEVLQAELERLAWADYAGGIGFGAARGALTGGLGGMLLTTSEAARMLNEAINTTPASELWVQNKNKLLSMGMNEDTVTLFLNNPVFSPALTTVIANALDSMGTVENRELFIKVSLQANSPDMAKVITEIALMTAGYHKHINPLKKLSPLARITRAEKENGSPVILLPIDYMVWSEKVKDLSTPLSEKEAGEIWTTGTLSKTAQSELEASGWKIHTDAKKELFPSKEQL